MKYAMDFLEITERESKPRTSGLTLVRDPGMGLLETDAFLESAGFYVDYIKFRNVTPRLHSEALLKDKISKYKAYQIKTFAGGIYCEMANLQGIWKKALDYLVELNFDALEISDNIVPFTFQQKLDMVKEAQSLGLEVIFEWGKKWPNGPLDPTEAAKEINNLLDAGVSKVVLEEAELNVVLGPKADSPYANLLLELIDKVGQENLIMEAVESAQQIWLLKKFGPTINIGPNVNPDEVLWLEPMRRGIGRKVDYIALEKWLPKK